MIVVLIGLLLAILLLVLMAPTASLRNIRFYIADRSRVRMVAATADQYMHQQS